jgi:hypothetical protein
MNIIKEISENEMIAAFLQAEIDSKRFQNRIFPILEANNLTKDILTNPNLEDDKENKARLQILTGYRGFDDRTKIFEGFPLDITWYSAELSKEELLKTKYIKYDYWLKLSNDTRSPIVAAENIKNGITAFDESNDQFIQAAESLKTGKQFPTLILVGQDEESYLVVLEGHLRLTALTLAEENIPEKTKVIIGLSKQITNWDLY